MKYTLGAIAVLGLMSVFATPAQACGRFDVSVGFGISGGGCWSDRSDVSIRFSTRDYAPVYRERYYCPPVYRQRVYVPAPIVVYQPAPVYCPPPVVIYQQPCEPPPVIYSPSCQSGGYYYQRSVYGW